MMNDTSNSDSTSLSPGSKFVALSFPDAWFASVKNWKLLSKLTFVSLSGSALLSFVRFWMFMNGIVDSSSSNAWVCSFVGFVGISSAASSSLSSNGIPALNFVKKFSYSASGLALSASTLIFSTCESSLSFSSFKLKMRSIFSWVGGAGTFGLTFFCCNRSKVLGNIQLLRFTQ